MSGSIKSLELIREALAGANEDLADDRAADEASTIANYLLALKHFGEERFEQIRCRKYRDVTVSLEARLRLLRGRIVPAIADDGGISMEAWGADIAKWGAQGGNCD